MDTLKNYVVFDLETSGINSKSDSIIEIGAVKVINNVAVSTFESFCRFDEPLKPIIIEVTSITDDMLENAPEKKEVLEDFVEFVNGYPLMGHNAKCFDMPFLNNELTRNNMPILKNALVDTLQLSYKYCPVMKNHKLISLLNYYNIEYQTLHRALDDAIATQKLYEKMVVN